MLLFVSFFHLLYSPSLFSFFCSFSLYSLFFIFLLSLLVPLFFCPFLSIFFIFFRFLLSSFFSFLLPFSRLLFLLQALICTFYPLAYHISTSSVFFTNFSFARSLSP
eukprot:Anaeramoba_ignava/a396668_3.p2 GENE.a396668_3~~a396668_3.p2  ORF type:complete len:107 (-),score=15.73 a396668_3:2-322(-)